MIKKRGEYGVYFKRYILDMLFSNHVHYMVDSGNDGKEIIEFVKNNEIKSLMIFEDHMNKDVILFSFYFLFELMTEE